MTAQECTPEPHRGLNLRDLTVLIDQQENILVLDQVVHQVIKDLPLKGLVIEHIEAQALAATEVHPQGLALLEVLADPAVALEPPQGVLAEVPQEVVAVEEIDNHK